MWKQSILWNPGWETLLQLLNTMWTNNTLKPLVQLRFWIRSSFHLTISIPTIDAHGLKIQGRGYLMFLAKIPRGGQGFQEKLPGGSPYFGFYCIFINKCLEICLRGVLYLPSPHLTPLCASMIQTLTINKPALFCQPFCICICFSV